MQLVLSTQNVVTKPCACLSFIQISNPIIKRIWAIGCIAWQIFLLSFFSLHSQSFDAAIRCCCFPATQMCPPSQSLAPARSHDTTRHRTARSATERAGGSRKAAWLRKGFPSRALPALRPICYVKRCLLASQDCLMHVMPVTN